MSMSNLDADQVIKSVYDENTGSLKVIYTTDASVPGTLTDRSGGTAYYANTSQTLMDINTSRKYMFIQNLDSTNDIYINFTSDASAGAGSIRLPAKSAFVMEGSFVSTEKVTVISAAASIPYTAKEG